MLRLQSFNGVFSSFGHFMVLNRLRFRGKFWHGICRFWFFRFNPHRRRLRFAPNKPGRPAQIRPVSPIVNRFRNYKRGALSDLFLRAGVYLKIKHGRNGRYGERLNKLFSEYHCGPCVSSL